MAYLSDIEIAQQCRPEHILNIAQRAHVDEKYVEEHLSEVIAGQSVKKYIL